MTREDHSASLGTLVPPSRLYEDWNAYRLELVQEDQFFGALKVVAPQVVEDLAKVFPPAHVVVNVTRPEWQERALKGGCYLFPGDPDDFVEQVRPLADDVVLLSRVVSSALLHWGRRYNLVMVPRTEQEIDVWTARDIVCTVEAMQSLSMTAVRRHRRSGARSLESQGVLEPFRRTIAQAGSGCRVAGRWVLRAVVGRMVAISLPELPRPFGFRWRFPPQESSALDRRYEWLVRSQVLRQSAEEIGARWTEDERKRLGRSGALRPPARRTVEEAVKRLRERLDLPAPEPLKKGRRPRNQETTSVMSGPSP